MPVLPPPPPPPVVGAALVHTVLLWVLFFTLPTGVSLLLHFFDDDDDPTLLYDVQPIYWTAFFGGLVLFWYAVGVVMRLVFAVTRVIPGLSWLFGLVVHFAKPLHLIIWGLVSIIGWNMSLRDEASEPVGGGEDKEAGRVGAVLFAFVLVGIIGLVVRAVLILLDFATLNPISEEMEEASFWASMMRPPVTKYDRTTGGHKALPGSIIKKAAIGRAVDTLNLNRVGLFQKLRVINEGHRVRNWGLHALSARMSAPPAGSVSTMPDKDTLHREVAISTTCFMHDVLVAAGKVDAAVAQSSSSSSSSDTPSPKGFGYHVKDSFITFKDVLAWTDGREKRAERVWDRLGASLPKTRINLLDDASDPKADVLDYPTVNRAMMGIYRSHMDMINHVEGRQVVADVTRSLLGIFAAFFSLLFFLAAFEVDLVSLLLPVSSLFLAASFAFSGVLSDFVWSLNLIYFVCPYDLRDIVKIGSDPTVYTVKRVTMMTTYLQDLEGLENIYPNGTIAKGRVNNLSRCATAAVSFKYQLDMEITADELAELRASMAEFVSSLPDIFKGTCGVFLIDVNNDIKFEVLVKAPVAFPWKDRGSWLDARDRLHFAFMEAVADAGLAFGADMKVKTIKMD